METLKVTGLTEAAKNELASLGEDVDDFVVQTKSKTQEIIKSYTAVASNAHQGVDVLDDNGNLRNTYQILLDIAKVYKEIQEEDKKAGTNRANALVETLAGKTRSNIAASILQNPEMLEDVYNAAQNADGSANEELEKQLESLEGHLARLSNAGQEFWDNFLNSDVLKVGIDFLTKLVESLTLASKIKIMPGLIGGGIFTALTNKSFKEKIYNGEITSAKDGAGFHPIESLKAFWADFNKAPYTKEDIDAIEKFNQEIANGTLSQEALADATRNCSSKGKEAIITANKEGVAIKALGNQSKAAALKLQILNTAKNMLISMGISLAISAITWGIQKLVNRSKEIAEEVEEITNEFSEQQKTLQQHKATLDEISGTYAKLSKGVDEFGNNLSLTKDGFDEYHKVTNQIAEMFPDLVKGWDNEKNAILKTKYSVEELNDAYDQVIKNKNNTLIKESDKVFEDYTNNKKNIKSNSKRKNYLVQLLRGELADEDADSMDSLEERTGIRDELEALGFKQGDTEPISQFIKRVNLESPSTIDSLKTQYENNIDEYLNPVKQALNAYIENKLLDNKHISDAAKQYIEQITSEFDEDFFEIYDTPQKAQEAADNLISYFRNLDTTKLEQFNKLLDPKISPKEKQEIYDGLKKEFETNEPLKLYFEPKIKDNEDFLKNYESVINELVNNSEVADEYGRLGNRRDKEWITKAVNKGKIGNIDFDSRPIIEWTDELKRRYKKELESWQQDPEIGSISTVLGGSERFGETENNLGYEIAFTPILPNGTLLSQGTVNDYINTLINDIQQSGKKVTEKTLLEADKEGKQVGDTYVKGIIAGAAKAGKTKSSDEKRVIKLGEEMHFFGKDGAIAQNQKELDEYFVSQGITTQEELDRWSEITKNIKDIDVAKGAWENFKRMREASQEAADGINSLSEAIKSVKSAFELFNEVQQEFSSKGLISADSIQKILTKFPDLEDELYEYIMGVRTGASVMDLLKSKSDSMASMTSEAFRKMYMSSNMVSAEMKATFANAFKSVGLGWNNTESVMANINSQIIDNNGNVCTTFANQWANACKIAGASLNVFASGLANLFSGGVDNISKVNGNLYSRDMLTGESVNLVDVQAVEIAQDLNKNKSNSKYWNKYGKYVSNGTADKDAIYSDVSKYFHGLYNKGVANKEELEKAQEDLKKKLKELGVSTDSESDKSTNDPNAPSYESNVDAVINRIKRTSNLINKDIEDIDKQLELIDIEDDPEKYKQLIESKLEKQKQLDKLYLDAQAQFHNEADYIRNNSKYNIASWFDEFGNETEAYYRTFNSAKTKDEQTQIKSLFDEVKKYKDAWEDMSEARHTANKDILESEEKITECLEKQCELVETLAKAHNDSYSNERTVLEREISDLEHKKNITNSATEKAKINSQLRDAYRRGMALSDTNMENVHSDAEYWRDKLKDLLSANGLDFDISKWFNESGEILEQFSVDLATVNDDNLQAEIQSCVNMQSEKKSLYIDFYEWRQEMEEKLHEEEQSYIDDLKDAVNELFDLRISKIDSENTLLSKHYDLINSIADEQHNLNKELDEANIAGAKMSEIERQTLFTKEEHTKLSSKLNALLKEAQDIQENYTRDLATATKDTIEEITNNYERQYELKLKEYEVVKAELSLAKAEQKLENVKNERSVRTWNGSSWVYEAVLQDVIDAQNELADAKYAVQQAKLQKEQDEMLGSLSATSDNLKTQQNQFATALDELSGKVTDASARVSEALSNLADVDLPMFKDLMFELGDVLNETLELKLDTSKYSSKKSSSGGAAFTYNPSTGAWTDNSTGKTTTSSSGTSTKVVGWQSASSLGLTSKKVTSTKKYAKGSKNTSAGLGLFDEEGDGSEVIMTKYGKLRQFSAGETVFSKDMTDRLYNMVKGNYTIPTALMATPDPSQYIKNNNNNSQDNRVYSINGITVGDDKGKEIIAGLADYLWRKS